jgi:phosphatidylglycerophosphatase C
MDFVRFCQGPWVLCRDLLWVATALSSYHLGLAANGQAKEAVLTRYFAGMGIDTFRELGQTYALTRLDRFVKPSALARLDAHRRQGARIIVLSASLETWIQPWCHAHQIECIATRVEVNQGKLTGRLVRNCHGENKVRMLREQATLADYGPITAYGDSSGDHEMLALADEAHYRVFR